MDRQGEHIVFFDLSGYQTSFNREIFLSWFPGRKVFPGHDDADLACYSREALKDFEVFYGRFSLWPFDFLGDTCRKLILIEPPLHRIVNSYLKLRADGLREKDRGTPLGDHDFRMLAANLTFEAFLEHGTTAEGAEIREVFDNCYAYFLCTRTARSRYLVTDVNSGYDPDLTKEQVLDVAIRNATNNVEFYYPDRLEDFFGRLAGYSRSHQPGIVMKNYGKLIDDLDVAAGCIASSRDAESFLHIYSELDYSIYSYFR